MTKKKRKQKDIAKELAGHLKGGVAVYIDSANIEKSVKTLGLIPPPARKGIRWKASTRNWRVNYWKVYNFFCKNSNLTSISFYSAKFGTVSHEKFLTFLKKNGYRLVTKSVKVISDQEATINRICQHCGKKSRISLEFICENCNKRNDIIIERKADFDVEISVDAVDWRNKYDTFVLFSGDSDFVYLVKYLKKRFNKTVIVISRRGHISKELRQSEYVDYYQDIYKLKDVFLRKMY